MSRGTFHPFLASKGGRKILDLTLEGLNLKITIRSITPADYEQWIAVENSVGSQHGTVADLEFGIKTQRPDMPWVMYVAEVDEKVVGITVGGAAPWIKPGDMVQVVIVLPEYRGKGIGTALYAYMQPFFAEHKPKNIRSRVQDDMPESLAWAIKRGYEKQHHIFDSTLAIDSFDPTPFAGRVEKAMATGIRFVHYDTIRTPENDRRLHEIFSSTLMDVPDAADRTITSFADWSEWFFDSPGAWPAGCLIAMDEAGEWLGFTAMGRKPGPIEEARIMMTGMSRESRGRGVALAIKLVATEFLRTEGYQRVVTNNHSLNGPMLAINSKMGYVAQPGSFSLIKSM
jgi:mycothiol synthase